MYQWLVGGSSLAAGSAVAALALLRAKRYRSVSIESAGREGFSPARYEPMKRLLSEEDLEFLRRRQGVPTAAIRRLKAERRKIFRTYLCELAADFNHLHAQARAMLSTAPEEYSELVGVMMGVQVRFWKALAAVEVRLVGHAIGFGRVDVAALLEPLQALHTVVYRASEPMESV